MYWYLFFAAFAAYFMKGLCGFANTLVFSTILSFRENNLNITPVDLLLCYPANLVMAVRERKSIKGKRCLALAAMMMAGAVPGIFFLKLGNAKAVKVFFGLVVLAVTAELLFKERKQQKFSPNRGLMAVLGVLSGLLCGLFGIGALLGAYLSGISETTSEFKGTFSAVCAMENTFRVICYIALGILTPGIVKEAALLLPGAALGLGLGMAAAGKLPEKGIKLAVIVLLMLSGISLVVTNLIS